jgi:hypothetical protein
MVPELRCERASAAVVAAAQAAPAPKKAAVEGEEDLKLKGLQRLC